MRMVRHAVAWGAAAVAVVALAALSRTPLRSGDGERSLLRLAWSARPERIETCRRPSAAELAGRPAHMRQEIVCEGRTASYQLSVDLDGTPLLSESVAGAGVRHDRALYLYRELTVTSGTHRVAVRFVRTDSGSTRSRNGDTIPPVRPPLASVPPLLVLDTVLTLAPNAVALITWDSSREALVIRTHEGSGRPGP